MVAIAELSDDQLQLARDDVGGTGRIGDDGIDRASVRIAGGDLGLVGFRTAGRTGGSKVQCLPQAAP